MHSMIRHLVEFSKDHWLWLTGGAALIGLFVLVIILERRGVTWHNLAKWGPVRWYDGHRTARRITLDLIGIGLILWLAQTFSLWVSPTLRPSMLFTPPVVGPQGVDLVQVQRRSLEDRVTYTGTVRPYETTVVYARTDGYVKALNVYPGDRVHTGQILATLETSDIDPRLAQARANAMFWKAERGRAEALFKGGSISQSALDRARQEERVARAQKSLLETRIGYATLRARADGVIAKRFIYPGVYVKKGQSVLSIDNLEKVRIRFDVGERDLLSIHPGSRVYLAFPQMDSDLLRQSFSDRMAADEPGKPQRIIADVAVVFPDEDPQTRTGTVEVRLPNPHQVLKSNTYVVGSLVRKSLDHVLVVPRSALTPMPGGKNVVFIGPQFSDDGTAKQRSIVTGLTSDRYVQIVKGVKEGAFVITRGNRAITDGQTVHVLHRQGGF